MGKLAIQNKESGASLTDMTILRDKREEEAGMSFDAAFERFLGLLKIKIEAEFNDNVDPELVLERGTVKTRITFKKGRRYLKLFWRNTVTREDGIPHPTTNGVYGFIDQLTGDVLMAASFKTPAKHARGNIFDKDPVAHCFAYGVTYLNSRWGDSQITVTL